MPNCRAYRKPDISSGGRQERKPGPDSSPSHRLGAQAKSCRHEAPAVGEAGVQIVDALRSCYVGACMMPQILLRPASR
jgi:hypothetical protein